MSHLSRFLWCVSIISTMKSSCFPLQTFLIWFFSTPFVSTLFHLNNAPSKSCLLSLHICVYHYAFCKKNTSLFHPWMECKEGRIWHYSPLPKNNCQTVFFYFCISLLHCTNKAYKGSLLFSLVWLIFHTFLLSSP